MAPLFGLGHVATLDIGAFFTLNLFGYEILSVMVDQQAKLFGYLFHIAALVAGIYSFHVRDPWQLAMSLLYAASAVEVAFAGDMLSLFLWWEGLRLLPFFKFGQEEHKKQKKPVSLSLFPHLVRTTSFSRDIISLS